jgi:hypothetical protein
MRGADEWSEGIFRYVRLQQRVPADHPLRAIRDLVEPALKDLLRDSAGFAPATAARRSRRNGCCGRGAQVFEDAGQIADQPLVSSIFPARRRARSDLICVLK